MRSLVLLSGIVLVACSPTPTPQAAAPPPPAPPSLISEAEAIAIVDRVPAALMAKDITTALASYADEAVLVDIAAPDLITTREANRAATEELLKSDISKLAVNVRKVQVLDADTFVVTEIVTIDMKPGGKASQAVIRITDVVQKRADGSWIIVNEHASSLPQAPKQPLPVIATFPAQ